MCSKFSGAGSSECSEPSGEKGGTNLVVANVGNGDANPGGDGRQKKPKGWYSQMLNSFSNKGADEQSESHEEIIKMNERRLSDDDSV